MMIVSADTGFKNYVGKGTRSEDPNLGRAHSAWPDLRCVWAKWFSQLPQHGTDAFRIGRAVYRRPGSFPLLLGCCRATNSWRCAAACESVRAPGSGASRAGDREHNSVSRVPESKWRGTGDRCDNPVVDCLLRASPIFFRDLCATNVITDQELAAGLPG